MKWEKEGVEKRIKESKEEGGGGEKYDEEGANGDGSHRSVDSGNDIDEGGDSEDSRREQQRREELRERRSRRRRRRKEVKGGERRWREVEGDVGSRKYHGANPLLSAMLHEVGARDIPTNE